MKTVKFICDNCKRVIDDAIESLISVTIRVPAHNPFDYHLCDSCMEKFKQLIAESFEMKK